MPGRVRGLVYTGARHSLTYLKFFSHSYLLVFRGGDCEGAAPPFGRRMLHSVRPSQFLVTFEVDPQPHFVFDDKSRVAIRRKSSLEFERVCFQGDFESPTPGDEGAYE